jgi:hypothetical protein
MRHSAFPKLVMRIDDFSLAISLYQAWEQMSSQRWQPMQSSSFVTNSFTFIVSLSGGIWQSITMKSKGSRLDAGATKCQIKGPRVFAVPPSCWFSNSL